MNVHDVYFDKGLCMVRYSVNDQEHRVTMSRFRKMFEENVHDLLDVDKVLLQAITNSLLPAWLNGFPNDWIRENLCLEDLIAACETSLPEEISKMRNTHAADFPAISHMVFRAGIYDDVKEIPSNSRFLSDLVDRVEELVPRDAENSEDRRTLLFNQLVVKKKSDWTSISTISLSKYETIVELDPQHATFINVLAKNRSPVDQFRKYIHCCHRAFSAETKAGFYAPYIALIQGSGSGKTTLVLNSGANDMFVVYLCLRPPPPFSSGLPKRSPTADIFVGIKSVEAFHKFYVAVFKTLGEYLAMPCHVQQTNRLQLLADLHKVSMSIDFWNKVATAITAIPSVTSSDVQVALKNCWSAHRLLSVKPPLLLFAIDEAKALCIPVGDTVLFVLWRHSIETLRGVFFVLMDTAAKVGNFYPVANDPSSRVVTGELVLVPPFYLFPFTGPWDALLDPTSSCYRNWMTVGECWKSKRSPCQISWKPFMDLVRFSRPLFWGILVHVRQEAVLETKWKDLLEMAHAKLGLQAMTKEESNTAEANNMDYAVLCVRFALSPLQSIRAGDLLAMCGATLVAVEPTTAIASVLYVPEPVFGEAAAATFQGQKGKDLLAHLVRLTANGNLGRARGKGDKGEFAGLVYLTLVMDAVQKQQVENEFESPLGTQELRRCVIYSRPVLLMDFLVGLIGLSEDDITAAATVLGDVVRQYAVAFTAWSDAESSPVAACLRNGAEKRLGWVLIPGETASDLVIPLISLISKLVHSLIAIQVKNWAGDMRRSEAVQLCQAQIDWAVGKGLLSGDTKMVSILLLTGEGRLVGSRGLSVSADDRAVLFQLGGHQCIVLNGFSSPHIGAEVAALLRDLRADPAHVSSVRRGNQMVMTKAAKASNTQVDKEKLQSLDTFAVDSMFHLKAWPGLENDVPKAEVVGTVVSTGSGQLTKRPRVVLQESSVRIRKNDAAEKVTFYVVPH